VVLSCSFAGRMALTTGNQAFDLGSFSFSVGASRAVEPGPSYARKGVPAALVRPGQPGC